MLLDHKYYHMKKLFFLLLVFVSIQASAQMKNVFDWTPGSAKDTSFIVTVKGTPVGFWITAYTPDSLWVKVQHSARADSNYCDMAADSLAFLSGTQTKAFELHNVVSKNVKVVINQVGTTKPLRILIDYVYSR